MKKLIFILACFVGTSVLAIGPRTYYVSNAGNNANNGLTTSASWQTLAQVNGTTFASGDSVLFKRGDVFYGSLTNVASGVTFADYGSGAKPKITGFITIAGWTNLGGNLYEALVPNGLSTVNMVVDPNGAIIPMGRYPNANAANSGYLTYENAHWANPDIIDAQLPNSPNWTGADIVIRKQDYVIARNQVVNHVDSTLTINQPGQFDYRLGNRVTGLLYGYFFENSPLTLDQNGEWYYNPSTTKIRMYYTSTPPTIQVATINNLINFPFSLATTKDNISIKNLAISGGEGDLVYISFCSNILIDSCDFSYGAATGFNHRNIKRLTVQNSTFKDISTTGIYETSPGGAGSDLGDSLSLIQNNNFKRIGIWPGMALKNNVNQHEGVSHTAISMGSPSLTIRNNVIDSTGYCGIIIPKTRERQIIRQNLISHFCFLKNDGGGIYNSGIRTDTASTAPLIIDSNIVNTSGDASDGTGSPDDPHTRGIYLDASSTNVQILNNTIYNSYEGIYISQAQRITIRGNTIYGAGRYIARTTPTLYSRYGAALNTNNTDGAYQHTINNTITRNIFIASGPNQPFLYQADRFNELASLGVVDSNTYVSPMGNFPLYTLNVSNSVAPTLYSFKQWQQVTAYDVHSTFNSTVIPANTIALTGSNKFTNETFTSDINGYSAFGSGTLSWDNTSKITGAGSAKLVNSTTSTTGTTQTLQLIGATDAAKTYVLRFKTKSDKIGKFETYIAQRSGAYNIITSSQYGTVDTVVEQHEIIFTGEHTTETTAGVYVNFSQSNNTVYIDDLQFYQATSVTPNNITNYSLFSANPTTAAANVSLGAFNYNTLDNTTINTSTSVPAYGSIMLFKGTAFTPPVYLNPVKLPFVLRRY